MMMGLATPTIEPLVGLNVGGWNGGAPVNGVESCPPTGPPAAGTVTGPGCGGASGPAGGGAANGSGAGGGASHGGGAGGSAGAATGPGLPGGWSGSAVAVPALSTSTQPNTETNPAAFRAAKRLLLVQPGIYTLQSRS